MNAPSLSDLIQHLSQIEAKTAERHKAIEDEQNNMLAAILSQLVGKAPDAAAPTVNDNADLTHTPPHPPARASTAGGGKRGGVKKLSDTDLIDALTNRYQTPPQIVEKLADKGIMVSKASIYARMAILADMLPDEVDEQASPLAWKIKRQKVGPDNAPVSHRNTRRVADKVKGSAAKAPRAANDGVVANDQDVAIPTDIMAPLLVKGDGLAMLRGMADKSVDLFLTDLPYGTTGLAIDPKIDLDAWMYELQRVVTDRGSIVAFSVNPFTTDLIVASRTYDRGIERFLKDDLIWEKPKATGYQFAHNRHTKAHENISVFSRGTVVTGSERRMVYNPQGAQHLVRKTRNKQQISHHLANTVVGHQPGKEYLSLTNCPRTVLYSSKDQESMKLHSFAKPLGILEYLIRTFSNPGDLVVDPTMGSGSAGVAALNTGRRFIGAENGTDGRGRCIFSIARNRIDGTVADKAA